MDCARASASAILLIAAVALFADDSTALWLSLGSHVRHVHTDYERLLAEGYDRDAARFFVADETDAVLAGWGCQRSVAESEDNDSD